MGAGYKHGNRSGIEFVGIEELAADGTTITFSGLDADANEGYWLTGGISEPNTGTISIELFANNNLVSGNYASQNVAGQGAVPASANTATARVQYCRQNEGIMLNAFCWIDPKGYFNAVSNYNYWSGANLNSGIYSVKQSSGTISSITQLDIVGGGNMEAGSWVQLRKFCNRRC